MQNSGENGCEYNGWLNQLYSYMGISLRLRRYKSRTHSDVNCSAVIIVVVLHREGFVWQSFTRNLGTAHANSTHWKRLAGISKAQVVLK